MEPLGTFAWVALVLATLSSAQNAAVDFDSATFDPNSTVINQLTFCDRLPDAVDADGTQQNNRTITCSNTILGEVPSVDRMVSTVILSPQDGDTIALNTPVEFRVRVSNMQLGLFMDPKKNYYGITSVPNASMKDTSSSLIASPQVLNKDGVIIGHQHIVAQLLEQEGEPLDPHPDVIDKTGFFKGLDQAPTGNNEVFTTFTKGFSVPGTYRVCSITGTRSHQPVIMPVARRGSQDDCIRITVSGNAAGAAGARVEPLVQAAPLVNAQVSVPDNAQAAVPAGAVATVTVPTLTVTAGADANVATVTVPTLTVTAGAGAGGVATVTVPTLTVTAGATGQTPTADAAPASPGPAAPGASDAASDPNLSAAPELNSATDASAPAAPGAAAAASTKQPQMCRARPSTNAAVAPGPVPVELDANLNVAGVSASAPAAPESPNSPVAPTSTPCSTSPTAAPADAPNSNVDPNLNAAQPGPAPTSSPSAPAPPAPATPVDGGLVASVSSSIPIVTPAQDAPVAPATTTSDLSTPCDTITVTVQPTPPPVVAAPPAPVAAAVAQPKMCRARPNSAVDPGNVVAGVSSSTVPSSSVPVPISSSTPCDTLTVTVPPATAPTFAAAPPVAAATTAPLQPKMCRPRI